MAKKVNWDKRKMGSGRKTEEQLTQEIMQLVNQLYDTMNGEPEAIQEKIASVLASSVENAAQKENEEDRIKARRAIKLARSGKENNIIIQETGMTVAAIRWMRKKEGIMSRGQVRDLIMSGKEDEEVKEEAGWTLEAVEEMRQEIEDRKARRQADRKERSDKRNAMLKAERQTRIQARKKEKEAKDQTLRIALARGLPIEEIAVLVGYEYPNTVRVKKSQEGILGRREISVLLPEKSDEELMEITGIEDISVIQEIRQEEMPKIEAAKEAAEQDRRRQEENRRKKEAEEARKQAFLIALAQGKTGKEIAQLIGLKNADSVKQKKHDMKALSRKQIIELLPEKSDEELMEITGITDILVIQKIRQEEMPATEAAKEAAEQERKKQEEQRKKKAEENIVKPNFHVKIPEGAKLKFELIISKQDEATFLKLAQSLVSVRKIAEQLELTEEQIREALYDYNIFTREEVVEWLPYKSDMQIAIMGDLKDYMVVAKVRKKEMARQLAEENEAEVVIEESPEVRARREEAMLFRMARNYMPVEKISSAFNMSEYKIILKIRKFGLYTRAEAERMIEKGEASNEKIAGEFGNMNAVARIRRKVQRRELIIRSIPTDKQELIRRKVATGIAASAISYDTRVNSSIIIAIQEKWKRDKDLEIPIERREVNLKIAWADLERNIQNLITNASPREKDRIQHMIDKILVVYEDLLTQRHCAYIAYVYMKMGKDAEGIEFAEDYLGLEDCSAMGVRNKIDEILEQERSQEKVVAIGESNKPMSLVSKLEESSR
ncbi:MAG: hypothetical protein HFJ31_02465 [Clostridia bacterium]|nr:hypothetical protein [Clostridia bacterium]